MFKSKIFKICFVIVLVVFVCYIIYMVAFQRINKRKRVLEMQLNMINKEIDYVSQENKDLKEGIYNSSKDEYLEKEARLNFGYKKDGETAVILSGTTTTKADDGLENGGNIWDKIVEWWDKL